jgi:hypothetical protein
MSQKTDAKFKIIYKHVENGIVVEQVLQKSNRFYMTNVSNGSGSIVKYDANRNRTSRIVAKYSVKPFNDYIEEDNYHLDFSFYLKECDKILYGKDKKTEGMKSIQGDLFGAMEDNTHLTLNDIEYSTEDLIQDDSQMYEVGVQLSSLSADDTTEGSVPTIDYSIVPDEFADLPF